MSSDIVWKDSEAQQLFIKFEFVFSSFLQPPIFLSVMVSNIPLSLATLPMLSVTETLSWRNSLFFFWRDEKQITEADYWWLAGMFSSSEHFSLGYELPFIILCSLVKCFSSNWFCKNHSLLETIVNFFICVWAISLYTVENRHIEGEWLQCVSVAFYPLILVPRVIFL